MTIEKTEKAAWTLETLLENTPQDHRFEVEAAHAKEIGFRVFWDLVDIDRMVTRIEELAQNGDTDGMVLCAKTIRQICLEVQKNIEQTSVSFKGVLLEEKIAKERQWEEQKTKETCEKARAGRIRKNISTEWDSKEDFARDALPIVQAKIEEDESAGTLKRGWLHNGYLSQWFFKESADKDNERERFRKVASSTWRKHLRKELADWLRETGRRDLINGEHY